MVSCSQDDKDYAGAQEMPPLQAPPGLDAPNTRNALKVPPLNTPERIRGKDEPCLDIPPPFASPSQRDAPAPRNPKAAVTNCYHAHPVKSAGAREASDPGQVAERSKALAWKASNI